LVIVGSEDRATPARVVRKVAARYGADYRSLPGHAHWLIGEPGWEEIAGQIHDWLTQQGLDAEPQPSDGLR
jgi:pimeloyl-ACP methyl ester carboxylesterase